MIKIVVHEITTAMVEALLAFGRGFEIEIPMAEVPKGKTKKYSSKPNPGSTIDLILKTAADGMPLDNDSIGKIMTLNGFSHASGASALSKAFGSGLLTRAGKRGAYIYTLTKKGIKAASKAVKETTK